VLEFGTASGGLAPRSSSVGEPSSRVITNLIILFVLAALAGGSALVLFQVLGRVESRAHWRREAGIARSRRLERRAFAVGVLLVALMAAGAAAVYLTRTPPCTGKLVVVREGGLIRMCYCEEGRRGACFDPGP
jgi:hypothetical protein